jgi:hypothetical protein
MNMAAGARFCRAARMRSIGFGSRAGGEHLARSGMARSHAVHPVDVTGVAAVSMAGVEM